MIEILVGFFAIAGVVIFLNLFFTTDLGSVIIALVFWSFVAYYIGKSIIALF